MNQSIQILFEDIKSCSPEEKTNRLTDIGKHIRSGYSDTEELVETVQELVNILPQENDLTVRKLLFNNISTAYTQNSDLEYIQLTPILNILNQSGPAFICNTLHLLSLTYNKKYLPVISRYLYSTDEKVREVAVNALTFIQYKSPLRRCWYY